jgi:RND family efflux transporter MFP subunit
MVKSAAVIIALFSVTACSPTTKAAKGPPPASEVQVVQVEPRDVPLSSEWIGTLDGLVNASVKAQVTGYLLRQDYKEGSFVKQGQLLFEIEPRPFQAALEQSQGQLAQSEAQAALARAQVVQAEAQLLRAEADESRTKMDVERFTPLVEQQAVSRQDLDNAIQNSRAAQAQVAAAKAAIETAKAQTQASNAAVQAAKAVVENAKLNSGFAHLTSPIDGIAGAATQQVGSLVGPNAPPITTISTLDPIKVNFSVAEQEYLYFAKQTNAMQNLQLDLILADGSVYAHKGKFYFADREVDARTGAIRLSALFPNPGNILRPGQYGRVRAVTRTQKQGLLVPQRAVTELQGTYQIAVVGPNNRVSIRNVKVGQRVGNMWIIEDGVSAGDRVVAEGVQKVRPDMEVNPKPFAPASEPKGN